MKNKTGNPNTKYCKYCRSEIDIKAVICPTCMRKQKNTGRNIALLVVFIIVVLFISALFMPDSDTEDTSTETPQSTTETPQDESAVAQKEEIVYIADADIEKVYTDADPYEGMYMKFTGQIFDIEVDDDGTYMQIYQDPVNYNHNTLVYYNGSLDVASDDYVSIDCRIIDTYSGENAFGGEISAPRVEAVSVEKISYQDAVSPTIKSVELNQVIDQNGYILTLNKIEFAANQTRCYFTFENTGSYEFSLNTYSIKLTQGSSQYESTYDFDSDYEELQTEVMPGIITSGVITFDALNPDETLSIYMDGYDNENYNSLTYQYDVPIQ